MRQQVAVRRTVIPVGEIVRPHAVLAGLVVFQPVAAQLVGQREQEIVVVVVVRVEQLVRLGDEVAVHLHLLRRHHEILRCIREHIEVHRHLGARVEIHPLEILARVDRRIDQRVERGRLECDGIARLRWPALINTFERGAELPAGRERDAGLDPDLARVVPGRIQRHRVPFQRQHLVGHLDEGGLAAPRQELEIHGDFRHTLRHVHAERVHVVLVALPLQRLAAGGDLQTREHVDRAVGRVIARDPFRIQQRQFARLHRNRFVHPEDALARVAGVDVDPDGARIRRVLRRRDVRVGGIGEGRACEGKSSHGKNKRRDKTNGQLRTTTQEGHARAPRGWQRSRT